MSDTLTQGQQITVGQHLDSQDGRVTLLLQSDGNLVLYRTADHQAVWASNTVGSGSVRAVMQIDGNFVLYDASSHPRWASGTLGNSGLRLVLQNDGNLVIYLGSAARWASGTAGSLRDRGPDRLVPPQELDLGGSIRSLNGRATLTMSPYWLTLARVLDGKRLWGASFVGGNYVKMQSDGNLVVYADGHHPVWASGTAGHEGAYLVLQDDGNLVVYLDTRALWASGTAGQITQWEPPHLPLPVPEISEVTADAVTASVQLDRQRDGGGHPWTCAFSYTKAGDATKWGVPGDTELFDGRFSARIGGLPADTDIVVYLILYNAFGQVFTGAGRSGRTAPAAPQPQPGQPTSGTTMVSVKRDGPDSWSYSADVLDPNGFNPDKPALIKTVTSTTWACSLSIGGSTRLNLEPGTTVHAFAGLQVKGFWSAEFSGDANDRPGAIPFAVAWAQ